MERTENSKSNTGTKAIVIAIMVLSVIAFGLMFSRFAQLMLALRPTTFIRGGYFFYLILGTIGSPFIFMFFLIFFGGSATETPNKSVLPGFFYVIVIIVFFLLTGVCIFSVIPLQPSDINFEFLTSKIFIEYTDTGLGIMIVYYAIFIPVVSIPAYICFEVIEKHKKLQEWVIDVLTEVNKVLVEYKWRIAIPLLMHSWLLGFFLFYIFLIIPFILTICFVGPFMSGNTDAYCPANSNTFYYSVFSLFADVTQIRNFDPSNSPIKLSYIFSNIYNVAISIYTYPTVSKIVTAVGAFGTFVAGIEYLFYKIPKWLLNHRKNDITEKHKTG